MAFPTNPSSGDSYTDEYGTVWVYAGAVNGWYRQTVTTPNDTSYTAAISGPAGSNTQVQFNDNGELAGDSGLTYNKTTDALSGGAFIPTGSTVPTNGLYLPDTDQVAISTNGTGKLFIDSAGKVTVKGVGTAAFVVEGTAPDNSLFIEGSTGHVGIGTSSPGQGQAQINITAAGASGNSAIALNLTNNSTDAGTGVSLRFSPGNVLTAARGSYINSLISGANGSDLQFWTCPDGFAPSERMRIDPAGNVGIGPNGAGGYDVLFNPGTSSSPLIRDSSGRLLVGTSSDSGGALLQVNGDRIRVATAKTPASATATGTTGEICWDASYIYVCTATNTWKRAALSTW